MSTSRLTFLAVMLAAVLPRSSGNPEEKVIALDWKVPSGDAAGFPDEIVEVGDTVTFSWTGNHNVFRHDVESCDLSDGTVLGSRSPQSYTFVESDKGERSVYFACHVGAHCSSGQHITFTVVSTGADDDGDANAQSVPSEESTDEVAEDSSCCMSTFVPIGVSVVASIATYM